MEEAKKTETKRNMNEKISLSLEKDKKEQMKKKQKKQRKISKIKNEKIQQKISDTLSKSNNKKERK